MAHWLAGANIFRDNVRGVKRVQINNQFLEIAPLKSIYWEKLEKEIRQEIHSRHICEYLRGS